MVYKVTTSIIQIESGVILTPVTYYQQSTQGFHKNIQIGYWYQLITTLYQLLDVLSNLISVHAPLHNGYPASYVCTL